MAIRKEELHHLIDSLQMSNQEVAYKFLKDLISKQRSQTEAELEKNLKEAKASLAIENLFLTRNEDELVKARIRGDISHAEFIKRASEIQP